MRSMVEGYVRSGAAYDLLCPSTTLRVVPLPRGGGSSRTTSGPNSPPLPLRYSDVAPFIPRRAMQKVRSATAS